MSAFMTITFSSFLAMITKDIHVLAAAVGSIEPRGNPLVQYKGLIHSVWSLE